MHTHQSRRLPSSPLGGPAALAAVFLLASAAVLLSGCPMPGDNPPADSGSDSTAPDPDGDGGSADDPAADPPVLSPGETTRVETGDVRIDLQEIYWVELDEIYVPLDRAVAIDIRVTNLTDSRVEYSGMYSWGVMITSEGEQIETTEWIGAANTQYFSGTGIAAEAFIRDTISFDELPSDSSPTSFEVKAQPPIDGSQAFEIHFQLEEVGGGASGGPGAVHAASAT